MFDLNPASLGSKQVITSRSFLWNSGHSNGFKVIGVRGSKRTTTTTKQYFNLFMHWSQWFQKKGRGTLCGKWLWSLTSLTKDALSKSPKSLLKSWSSVFSFQYLSSQSQIISFNKSQIISLNQSHSLKLRIYTRFDSLHETQCLNDKLQFVARALKRFDREVAAVLDTLLERSTLRWNPNWSTTLTMKSIGL